MVMPRSRSMSIESSSCSFMSRSATVPVDWISRSASVDLPWSMWATMEKLRMCAGSVMGPGYAAAPGRRQAGRPWAGTVCGTQGSLTIGRTEEIAMKCISLLPTQPCYW